MSPGDFQISLKVFLTHGASLLVLRERATGRGDLPGGRIARSEFYDPWPRCVARELREELGSDLHFRLRPEPLFVFPHFIESAGRDALGVAYRADYDSGPVRLSDEHDAFDWVAVDGYEPEGFFAPHMADAVRRFQRLHYPHR